MLVNTDFSDTTHGQLGCIGCHGGQEGILEKEEAHVGMVADPSVDGEACQSCHPQEVEDHASSLHLTQQGYFTAMMRRGGDIAGRAFHDMFESRCAECHANCGACHVSRPTSVGGGLTHGHTFRKMPSQTDQCTACHGSRVGAEFRGENAGIPADVHRLSGMTCMDCHTSDELHGDGTTPDDRFANEAAGPACLNCHEGADSPESSVLHHSLHAGRVACQVCHSVEYKNCYSCHVELDSQGLQFPSEIDFRIGLNPRITEKRPYQYVLLRHIPIAPDTFEPWGIEMPDYAATPTWRLATPHNIQRNAPQSESCDNCHGSQELFLTPEYINELIDRGLMTTEEIEANASVVVSEPIGGPSS